MGLPVIQVVQYSSRLTHIVRYLCKGLDLHSGLILIAGLAVLYFASFNFFCSVCNTFLPDDKGELSMNKVWCQELGQPNSIDSSNLESMRLNNMQYITWGQSHNYCIFGSIVNVLDKIHFCLPASLPQPTNDCDSFEHYQ